MRADGFTLVELLVALAVVGLVMVATLTVLERGQQGYLLAVARLDAQQRTRVALERVAREIRTAGFDPTGAGFAAVVDPTPTSLTIRKDLNGNGVIDAAGEAVTYLLRGTTLRRNAGGGAQPVIEGVEGLVFSYLDAEGAATTLPEAIRTVVIALTVHVGPSPGVATMGTQVRLRNR
ncbi:MAG: prepilin-type N-terminal cleavage/methylation domain-containing protein [Candidatus Rokubacteria bacterium]|nr:prepilin-type N-terminal cleavage/methylation domain-containing protein [Candidatus Rokubacteria bacterium]